MNESPTPYRDSRPQLERLRGMLDVGPSALRQRQCVLERIHGVFARHGYEAVETPVVEPTELFLRKSGGERVAQMYAFHYRDREIALRPEHTASILRMYADTMQSEPLPRRLMYAGPVFRYEKPQAGRSRQFTEVGCELFGAPGPAGDAEVIHLALEGLHAVGVEGKLVLGHIGIVHDFLNRLPLRQRARDWLVWGLERLRKGQEVDLDAEIAGLVSGGRLSDIFDEMSLTLRDVPAEQLEGWVLEVLREVGVQMQGGTRTPEEIVAGVIRKMNRTSDEEDVRQAFAFVRELSGLHGTPDVVLPNLRQLIQRHGLHDEPLGQIEQVLDLLAAYGHSVDQIELNLGLGRGLHYYTGILFEIHEPGRRGAQLCGGGRYDDLAQMLGARQSLPACGFSYGLERVAKASSVQPAPGTIDALVVPEGQEAMPAAIRVIEEMREQGSRAELDVRGRSGQAARRYALRQGVRQLVLVDAKGEVRTELLQEETSDAPAGEGNDD